MNLSIDDGEFNFFSDSLAKEEELRRLNDELDLRLDIAENDSSSKYFNDFSFDTGTNKNDERQARNTHRGETEICDQKRGQNGIATDIQKPSQDTYVTGNQRHSQNGRSSAKVKAVQLTSPKSDNSFNGLEDEIQTSNKGGMGPKAIIRVQRARIKALESQRQYVMSEKNDTEELRSQLKGARKENQRLQKYLNEVKSVAEKKRADENSSNDSTENLLLELNEVKRDLASAQKSLKVAESEYKSREVRLSRALEEVEKYKNKITAKATEKKQDNVQIKKDQDILLRKIKLLERQRSDLLMAFKKQMKLIDVLKRQRVHAEAAKLLQFTEENFVKVLDWGAYQIN